MQDALEVTGMVLSSMPIGEADRRVVLLTAELGRISAFARGARKPTSALVSATRTFAFGRFTVFPGRNSYSVGRADIAEYFEDIVGDVKNTAYGCYLAELAVMFSRENADGKNMLALLYFALRALARGKMDAALVRRVYELALFHENGVLPDFSVCPDCGKRIDVFGKSHVEEISAAHGIPVLARLPIDPEIAEKMDQGKAAEVNAAALSPVIDALLKD